MFNDIKKRFKLINSSRTFNNIYEEFSLGNKKVLDLGCGYGEYLVNFAKKSLGITNALSEVEYGKKNNINIIHGNIENIDRLDINYDFDVIWANNFFEHILSPHSFLMKLKKNANKNTLLILGVPVIPKFISLLRLKKFRGSLATNHINFFTKDSLKLTTERAGWNVVDIRPFISNNGFLDRLSGFIYPHLYIVASNNIDFKYPDKK